MPEPTLSTRDELEMESLVFLEKVKLTVGEAPEGFWETHSGKLALSIAQYAFLEGFNMGVDRGATLLSEQISARVLEIKKGLETFL